MKIQCDVCEKDEASLFCVADEAALCAACDHRVHHANKLAGKHQRFSLHHPSPPLCDICQERRAFLFCQQDRAILCRECDVPIHKANEHTQKHARFLLTGVKLSATPVLYSASQSSAESASDAGSSFKSQDSKTPLIPPTCAPSTAKGTAGQSTQVPAGGLESSSCEENFNGPISTSSISEYLIEMLPGWHVEDFLDSSSDPSPSSYKGGGGESDLLQIWDADLGSSNMSGFPTEKVGSWVPQMANPLHQTQINQSYQMMGFGTANGFRQQSKEFTANNVKCSRKRNEDNSFAVPQMRPSSAASKRSRTLW
ncbi:B-box zinc finger protein 21 [Sesamum alatum]|uniref:B-box zinc finger protein 21 n=1 Tax=Sesamum alatum TaxID=300844 RepID=A0AAE1YQ62_9LAMI|nr:B-box zinc finger protein 21 [Sesamum alatum]